MQLVENWKKTVNSLRLRNIDIFLTGSNSKLLSSELATFLNGRYDQFKIMPLLFKKFIDFRMKAGLECHQHDIHLLLKDYIQFVGFPLLSTQNFILNQSKQIIKAIHSSIVLKDIISRNKMKRLSPIFMTILAV